MRLRIGGERQRVRAGFGYRAFVVAIGGKFIVAPLAVGSCLVLVGLDFQLYILHRQHPEVGVVRILCHSLCHAPVFTIRPAACQLADDAHRLDDDGLLDGGPYLHALNGIGIVEQRHLRQCQLLVGADDKLTLGEGVTGDFHHCHTVLHDFRQHGLARCHLDGGTATLRLNQEGLALGVVGLAL